MKLKIGRDEYWIRDNVSLPSEFDSMSDHEKWDYLNYKKLYHRLDGPAVIEEFDGTEFWYLNDKCVDGEIYQKIQNSSKEELLVYLIDPKYKDYLPLIEHRLNR